MPYDTVSLCHSPEEIFKLLSGAVKAECAALLQRYSLQCVRLQKLPFLTFLLQSIQITASLQETLNYIVWIPQQPPT